MVEEVVIETLRVYDIEGYRDEDNTGVWVGDNKVAAVGVSSSRWITTHGFAINVDPDLSYFDTSIIIPCGIEGKGVTSISKILRERGVEESSHPSLLEVADATIQSFERVFGVLTEGGNPLK
jgi:lipoate-protein ligase B